MDSTGMPPPRQNGNTARRLLLITWCCDASFPIIPLFFHIYLLADWPCPLSPSSWSKLKGTVSVHSVLTIQSFLCSCNLFVFIGVLFSPFYLIVGDVGASLCVNERRRRCLSVGIVPGALVLVKKKKIKSESRAVTVKCCRSPCDLEHRNNNCTFSIFYFLLFHAWFSSFPPHFT